MFKANYIQFALSHENGPIAIKRKTIISIECWVSNVAIHFDHGHDHDFDFFNVKTKIWFISRKYDAVATKLKTCISIDH